MRSRKNIITKRVRKTNQGNEKIIKSMKLGDTHLFYYFFAAKYKFIKTHGEWEPTTYVTKIRFKKRSRGINRKATDWDTR